MDLTKKYKQQTDVQHVLSNAGMYIGSLEPTTKTLWIYDEKEEQIQPISIEFHEGLYKLFDEALTNCYDHTIRVASSSYPVTTIKIEMGKDISFYNDGEGIDIEIHPETGIYIPEMIFAHLRTSTNYGSEDKIVGGRHGLGIKLVSIWSTRAEIDIIDQMRNLSYKQAFLANLSSIEKPVLKPIKRALKSGATKITFTPDFEKFHLKELPNYMEPLLKKRAYDLSILLPEVKIYFNGKLLTKRAFKTYISTCFPKRKYALFESKHWKIALCLNEDGFYQLSLVNGIQTLHGGRHVDEVLTKLLPTLCTWMKERKKVTVTTRVLKDYLGLFIICNVINPSFIGQVKDGLASGQFCEPLQLSAEFLETAYKIIAPFAHERVTAIQEYKKKKEVEKLMNESNGAPRASSIRGVPELVDANWAGTARSTQCILILCEGESSATGILSGLTNEHRNRYGVYPLRGKIINPRGKGAEKISADKIVVDLKKILGLKSGLKYTSAQQLRYGKIIFMTDQDLDGHHIKGLGINLFATLWPSLLQLTDLFGFIQTPILKARKNGRELTFYYEQEYQQWRARESPSGWTIKYYKGLGTSTPKEFKAYFARPREIYFTFTKECKHALTTAFGGDADERKKWLQLYDRSATMQVTNSHVECTNFIHKELIHFSKYDCERSIPSIDGLKLSQRKILYVASLLLKGKEMKVAQFCGNVAEKTHYHHGEVSLEKAVVGMAQNFVGSNNFNLLLPIGQFGSRIHGGEDAAQPRYIFTTQNSLTPYIYRKEDEPILDYLEDDGQKIEPRKYVPIIPMILVNGAHGIGTGYSCSVLPYKLTDIVKATIRIAEGQLLDGTLTPYFEGFKGRLVKGTSAGSYITYGTHKYSAETLSLTITELPIGYWTRAFKEHLEKLMDTHVQSYVDQSTDTHVLFHIKLKENTWTDEGIIKTFKLSRTHHETNMYLFDYEDKLQKYNSPLDILMYYKTVRLEYYERRKAYMIRKLEQSILILQNRVKYIQSIISGELSIFAPKSALMSALEKQGYSLIDNSYNYLLKMTIDSLCQDNALELEAEYAKLQVTLSNVKTRTSQMMWLADLKELQDKLLCKKRDSVNQ